MADHRRAKRAKRFLAHFNRSGDVQFDVIHKYQTDSFSELRGSRQPRIQANGNSDLAEGVALSRIRGMAPYALVSGFAAKGNDAHNFNARRWQVLIKSLIAPALVLIFFGAAPHWYNSRVRSSI